MTICDELDIVRFEDGMKGIDSGNLYCTLILTRFPGLLQGKDDGVHVDPVVGQVVVTVTLAGTIPGKSRLRTNVCTSAACAGHAVTKLVHADPRTTA